MDDAREGTVYTVESDEAIAQRELVWRLSELADVLESLQNRAGEGAARANSGALAEYRWGEENAYFVARSWLDAIIQVATERQGS